MAFKEKNNPKTAVYKRPGQKTCLPAPIVFLTRRDDSSVREFVFQIGFSPLAHHCAHRRSLTDPIFPETLQKMLKNLFTSRALCADFGLLILRAGLTLSLREIL